MGSGLERDGNGKRGSAANQRIFFDRIYRMDRIPELNEDGIGSQNLPLSLRFCSKKGSN
jgi:hypothetical protein